MNRKTQLQPAPMAPLAIADEPEGVDEDILEYVKVFSSQPGACGLEYITEGSDKLLDAMAPKDSTELMVCSQVVSSYHASLRCLAQAEPEEQGPSTHDLAHPERRKAWEAKDRSRQGWARIAVSMLNASAKLTENLAKLKGGLVSQRVVVEHLNAEPGSQVAIAPMVTGGGEGGDQVGGQR